VKKSAITILRILRGQFSDSWQKNFRVRRKNSSGLTKLQAVLPKGLFKKEGFFVEKSQYH